MSTASTAPFPFQSPQEWTVQIGAVDIDMKVMRVLLKDLKTSAKLDKKGGSGRDGATITYQGRELATFSIELAAWDQTGWEILDGLVRLAHKQEGDPLVVYHPLLEARGIDKMVVEAISGPEFGDGLVTATLECVQWAPPPKKAAKPVTSTPRTADVPTAWRGGGGGGRGGGDDGGGGTRPSSPSSSASTPSLPKPSWMG